VTPDVRCQLCNQSSFVPVIQVRDANFSSNIKSYSILRCSNCELSTMSPFPTIRDIEELYVKDGVFSVRNVNPYAHILSFRFLEPLYQKYGTDLRFIANQCLRLTRKRNPSILDLGCSVGRLLNAFKLAAPELEVSNLSGIDIDPNAKNNAIPFLKERIVIANFLEYQFDRQFDIVTMRYVIEHLLDFRAYIERAVSILKPGGIMFISTPDIDSAQARLLKENWKLINDPNQKIGHLRWFNQKSMEFLAREFGLRVEKCVHRGEMIYHLTFPLQNLLRRVLGTDPASGRFIKNYTPRILNATFFDGALSHMLNYGEGLYVFLRKY
jgi:2-polyprenyl-3-methyl-5-hydroxy-6-metoxy-1,4-benzoquinol methylase